MGGRNREGPESEFWRCDVGTATAIGRRLRFHNRRSRCNHLLGNGLTAAVWYEVPGAAIIGFDRIMQGGYFAFFRGIDSISNTLPPGFVFMSDTNLEQDLANSVVRQPQDRVETRSDDPGLAISEARLVEDARRGEQRAFGELVLRYERRLIRVIARFVPDWELARDLAQETFLRAYERLDQFDPSRRFGPWLFRIGVNLTLDHLRKRKRRGRWSLFSESPTERLPDPSTPDPRHALELSQEVRAVLERIPEKYRSVLVLRDLENFTTSEIAAILERKEATIRWRLAEARNRFQKLWSKRLGDQEVPLTDETNDDEL